MRTLRLLLLPVLLTLLTFADATAQNRNDDRDDRPRVILGDDDDRRERGRRGDRDRDDDDVRQRERGRRGDVVRGRGDRKHDDRERDDDWERDDDDDWERDDDDRDGGIFGRTGDVYGKKRGKSSAKRGGPAFCRSGAGHPVHGRQWCYDKGFGVGSDSRGLGDIILRRPDRTRRGGLLSPGTLEDVLGRRLYRQLDDTRRSLGLSAPLDGRLVNTRDGRGHVLQLRSGRTPFGELFDLNGDGRVDDVRLRDRR